jgi:hypothetical protein
MPDRRHGTPLLGHDLGSTPFGVHAVAAAAQRSRCPDGSWSKFGSRRCSLPMGHTGRHVYEVRGSVDGGEQT